ncbi:hypothetical protein ALP81_200096 [Pseudomonas savastanoi pv. fraxini]|nr:hypothetical protein ALP81_200096 [Pseudomonas savastanoi pv. fraxini]
MLQFRVYESTVQNADSRALQMPSLVPQVKIYGLCPR